MTGPAGAQGPQGASGVAGTAGSAGGPGPAGAPGPSPTQVSALGVNTSAGPAGTVQATGDITAFYSDSRLKDVAGKVVNALELLKSINGVYYQQNELAEKYGYPKDTSIHVGLIAQEVESILPEVIRNAPFDADKYNNSKSGERFLTVIYEKLVPLLIEALKEQKEQIEYIKSKIKHEEH